MSFLHKLKKVANQAEKTVKSVAGVVESGLNDVTSAEAVIKECGELISAIKEVTSELSLSPETAVEIGEVSALL